MSEHVTQYLDCERLRLRAERAERLSTMWRLTGWAFGLVLACLLAVVVWQERQLATSDEYAIHAGRAERAAHQATETCEINLEWVRKAQFQHFVDLGKCQADLDMAKSVDLPTVLCSQEAADIDDARIAAEQNFKRCLSANAGLVDSLREFDRTIKDQQQLINDSIALAKRCEAEPTSWVVVPTASQVLPP